MRCCLSLQRHSIREQQDEEEEAEYEEEEEEEGKEEDGGCPGRQLAKQNNARSPPFLFACPSGAEAAREWRRVGSGMAGSPSLCPTCQRDSVNSLPASAVLVL